MTPAELGQVLDTVFASADGAAAGAVTRDALVPAVNKALPVSGLAAAFNMGGRGGQPQTPDPVSVQAMMAALPATATAKPARPRKVLVRARGRVRARLAWFDALDVAKTGRLTQSDLTMFALYMHLLAGMQYVLGDLKADDTPSSR